MTAPQRAATGVAASAALFAIAVASPLDGLSDASFAWHMLQHMVLFFFVPLPALLSRPFDLFLHIAGKARATALVRNTKWTHALASIPAGYAALTIAFWGTHFSGLYELALERAWIHVAEHALYVACGTLFWLPAIAPPPLRPAPYAARAFYLFCAIPQGALLGAALFAARLPLYPHYVRALSFAGALADQRNAAAIMWMGGGLVLLCGMLLLLRTWAMREAA